MAEAPKMITELTDILDQDIETIVALRMSAERKVSRHQRLIEDLRRAMPTVKNHFDPEVEAMKEPIDPHTALTALNETLQEATREYELELE